MNRVGPGLNRVVLGVGLSSGATREELDTLVQEILFSAGIHIHDVACIATRMRFVGDQRIRIGLPVIGVEDLCLLQGYPRPDRTGFAARVAEGCALIGAGNDAEMLVGTIRSAHATAAVAKAAPGTRAIGGDEP